VAVLKKSVAFDEKVGREALAVAGEGGFSAFVNEAVALRLQRMRIQALFNAWDAEFGPVPDEVQREVEAEWAAFDAGR
jgi:hypothetical protein